MSIEYNNTHSQINLQSLRSEWLHGFENILHQFNDILKLSDDRFTLISEKVRRFHTLSKGISDKAIKVTKNISGKDYKANVEKLKTIFNSISLYLSEVQNRFDKSENSLNEIVQSLERIMNEGSGFKKLVRHLEVQG